MKEARARPGEELAGPCLRVDRCPSRRIGEGADDGLRICLRAVREVQRREQEEAAGGGSRLVTQPRGLCGACGTLNKPSAKVCAECGCELKVPERKVYVPGLNHSDNG